MRDVAPHVGRQERGLFALALTVALGAPLLLWSAGPLPRAHSDDGEPDIKAMLKVDTTKIVGHESCQKSCHDKDNRDYLAWLKTKHYRAKDLLLSEEFEDKVDEIVVNLDLDDASENSLCVTCHGQPAVDGDDVKLAQGVTCEMCHGPAKDWKDLHGDEKQLRDTRIAASIAAGMITPYVKKTLYDLAANCLDCHTVPNPKLIEVGGHPMPRPFELVAWSQGEVRHNFNTHKGHTSNEQNGKPHLRRMYLVGRLVDLEYSLRALSLATEDGKYSQTLVGRLKALRADLGRIDAAVPALGLKGKLGVALTVPLAPGTAGALAAAAKHAGAAAKALAAEVDGDALAAIDGMLPDPSKYMGTVFGK